MADFPSVKSPGGILPSCEIFFNAINCSLFSLDLIKITKSYYFYKATL